MDIIKLVSAIVGLIIAVLTLYYTREIMGIIKEQLKDLMVIIISIFCAWLFESSDESIF